MPTVYDRANQLKVEDQTGKWRAKVAGHKPKLTAEDAEYVPMNPNPELVNLLFPELQ